MIFYRRLTLTDTVLLAGMGSRSLLQSHGHSAPAEVMADYAARYFNETACRTELADEQNIFGGLFETDKLVGYFKLVYNTHHPAVPVMPVTKLERLYLLEEFYDRGLGQALMEKAIAVSKAAGDQGIWLEVWKENHRALRFYQKAGFTTAGESQFVLTAAHTNPVWVMMLRY